jgi:hypothetical protein
MQKLIYASVVIATLFVPLFNARKANFEAGLRRSRLQMLAFMVAWAFGCIYAYTTLG